MYPVCSLRIMFLAAVGAAGAAAHEVVADLARKEKVKEKEKKRATDILSGGDGEPCILSRFSRLPCIYRLHALALAHADAYAECYPSYYDYGTMVMEDSDDEGEPAAKQVSTSYLALMTHYFVFEAYVGPLRRAVCPGVISLPRRNGRSIKPAVWQAGKPRGVPKWCVLAASMRYTLA